VRLFLGFKEKAVALKKQLQSLIDNKRVIPFRTIYFVFDRLIHYVSIAFVGLKRHFVLLLFRDGHRFSLLNSHTIKICVHIALVKMLSYSSLTYPKVSDNI